MKLTMGDQLKLAFALSDKRERYSKNIKPCPECGTKQVQLVDWINGAEWKCRHCGHEWTTEEKIK